MALRLRGATSGYIELKAPASAGDNTLTLPTNNGSANQLLKTDGSGNLSWVDDNSGVSLSGSTDNTLVTVTGANALQGESVLTFDGNDLQVRPAKANFIVAKSGLTVKANSALHTSYDLIQLGAGGALASYSTATATADTQFIHNAYRSSGGSWKYRYADTAARLRVNSPARTWVFESAVSGSADGDISFIEQLRITSAGEVLIGRTSKANDINKLVVSGTSPADTFDSQLFLEGSETSGAANTGGALAFGGHDGSTHRNWANIYGMKENGTGGNYASYLSFHTRAAAGGSPEEKLRIHSDGKMSLGTSSSASAKFNISHGNEFALYTSGPYNYQAKFESTDAEAAIVIEDSNSTNDANRIGVITDDMTFITNNSENLRIKSNGSINFSNTTIATKNTAGDITIDFGNLTDNGGNNWRKCGVWILYNGIDTDATDNKSVIYYTGVGSVTTWNWVGDSDTLSNDSFGSVTLQNAAATSFRLYCDVNNQNTGSVTVLIHAWNTKPTITIN